MSRSTQISIPTLVRVKEGALDRLGLYQVFWATIAENPFSRSEWVSAIRAAPSVKDNYFTILSRSGAIQNAEKILNEDPHLLKCFRD